MKKNDHQRGYSALIILTAVGLCAALLCVTLVATRAQHREKSGSAEVISAADAPDEELRGIWIPYYSEIDITPAMIDDMVQKCSNAGFNTIIFHVRAFGDAMYRSDYFPWSHFITGTQGQPPADGFDPLLHITQKAHENGMELHAWINPLRIQYEGGSCPRELSADNPYCVWRGDDDAANDLWVVDYKGGKYYNPAYPQVRRLITDGIAEIAARYDVDGIHWDDYFYPAEDDSFDDSAAYSAYLAGGGTAALVEWRTENINALVRESYAAVKAARPDCVFGISPAGNIENCLAAGADVYEWCANPGYIDYICPQVYWPFESEVAPFAGRSAEWRDMIKTDGVKFYVGLALYKGGSETADSGLWYGRDDIIASQIRWCRSDEARADGYMVFAYDDMFTQAAKGETANMIAANKEPPADNVSDSDHCSPSDAPSA